MMTFLLSLLLTIPLQNDELNKKLSKITAYYTVDENLASSGNISMDQYELINAYGFQHVINLLPGNQLVEKKTVTGYGMTYTQIPVDFRNPTVENFEAFKKQMNEYKGDKIYVHCAANMRASAFIFTYRVTQLGVDKNVAKEHMDKVWAPTRQWNRFIREVLEKYNVDPSYRTGNDFTMLARNSGVTAAIKSFKSKDQLDKKELKNLANEIEREKEDKAAAVKLYEFLSNQFPDEVDYYLQLGRIYTDLKNNEAAINAFKKVVTIQPKHLVATKSLGKLGVEDYKGYWNGISYDASKLKAYAGTYLFKQWNRKMTISNDGTSMFIQPEWRNQPSKIYKNPDNEYFLQEFFWKVEFGENPDEITLVMMAGDRFPGKRVNENQ